MLLFGFLAAASLARLLQTLALGVPSTGRLDTLAHHGLVAQSFLSMVFLGSMAALILMRKEAVRKLPRLAPQGAAVAGTWLITTLGFQPLAVGAWWVPLLASLLMLAGMVGSILALLTLGRCFGILPEARGLVTSGPYRYVRHPLYTAEAVTSLGLLLAVVSPFSVAVYGAFIALQALRTRYEEEVLLAVFPEYAAYRQSTWRFLPGLV